MLEVRTAASLEAGRSGRVQGYAAVFNSQADLGEFVETIRAGAFASSLASPDNILALYDHERRSVLGRAGAGTLKLAEDTKGLHFELELPDTSTGRDLATLIRRGDVRGCSFGFTVPAEGDKWEYRERMYRELINVGLHEITITATPAYQDTTVAMRAAGLERFIREPIKIERAWLETA